MAAVEMEISEKVGDLAASSSLVLFMCTVIVFLRTCLSMKALSTGIASVLQKCTMFLFTNEAE